jgi:hypothetical protein
LRVSPETGICVGAIFDVLAVVTEWSPDGVHRIESLSNSDFSRLDTDDCGGGGVAPAPGDLVLNEFLADPPPELAGDANCDGARDSSEDEFVEIVNVSDTTLDLSGVTYNDINDDTTLHLRFTFPPATTLEPGHVALIYGAAARCDFPDNVQTFVASTLSLNNAGDTITLLAADGTTTLVRYVYPGTGPSGEDDQSLNLNPDLIGTSYALHDDVPGAVGVFSPGRRVDGSSF